MQLKILLLGEFSGFFNVLALEFKKLGHTVTTVSNGDGFKNYKRDINIGSNSKNVLVNRLEAITKEFYYSHTLKGYDIVLVVNPLALNRFGFTIHNYKQIARNNGALFLTLAGDDYFFWKAFRDGKFRYSPHHGTLADDKATKNMWESSRCGDINRYLVDNCKGIISTGVEYHLSYVWHGITPTFIPLPVQFPNLVIDFNTNFNPLKILHGVQSKRKGFKGSNIIDKALAKFTQENGEGVICKRVEDVPFNHYQEILSNTHILIDQCNSYGPGMNALLALAQGKIVLGGFEKEYQNLIGVDKEFILNIKPDEEHILSQLKFVNSLTQIEKSTMISAGRSYIEEFHNVSIIAKKYITFFLANS